MMKNETKKFFYRQRSQKSRGFFLATARDFHALFSLSLTRSSLKKNKKKSSLKSLSEKREESHGGTINNRKGEGIIK